MQDFERFGKDLERSNSKESYKEYVDYKDRRNECDKRSTENIIETNSRSAAEKLSEVFERKSIGISETVSSDSSVQTPGSIKLSSPVPPSARESSEKEFSKTSWADAVQDEQTHIATLKTSLEKVSVLMDNDKVPKDPPKVENDEPSHASQSAKNVSQLSLSLSKGNLIPSLSQIQSQKPETSTSNTQGISYNQVLSQSGSLANSTQSVLNNNHTQMSFPEQQVAKPSFSAVSKQNSQNENLHNSSLLLPTSKQMPEPQTQIAKPKLSAAKTEKELSESDSVVPKSSTEPTVKYNETQSTDSLQDCNEGQKRHTDDKKNERFTNEQHIKIPLKEPIERKSSGSGSEKKVRGYAGSGGYAVYNRGWGSRESRGRRSHRSSRSNNRASESDGSTDGALNSERRERRRAPRSPRGPKKSDKPDELNPAVQDQTPTTIDILENREPFAPRGQPSRRGRGGFQGSARPPAPAKRVVGYGPPNTKSPFSQANRAVKDTEEVKDNIDDRGKPNKPRAGSTSGRGRDRRPKGGAPSGEDENWETTSEHSEGGGTSGRRRSAQSQKNSRNANSSNRQNGRISQGGKKDVVTGENKTAAEITEAISDLKLNTKNDEVIDDGFQEVRNKKSSKDTRPPAKEDGQGSGKQSRSHSNQGNGRNRSSTRNSNDKSTNRSSAPVPGKSGSQYDRPRQANLAPRFVKQRQQRQQVGGLVSACGPDTGAAPPPPAVNAWDKPISQTLRGNVEENVDLVENKSAQSSQRSTPAETSTDIKTAPTPCTLSADKTSMLDGATPPVETIIFENTNYKTATPDEALQQKYQLNSNMSKNQTEEVSTEIDSRSLTFNGEVRGRPRSIQELMAESGRQSAEGDASLGLQMSFDTTQKTEDSDMKLDFGFDSDLGQLSEDKSAKSLGLPRGVHMSTSNTISPLAADLNLKIASVKKVWEMPAVAENTEELQFTGFEETNTESAPPNVCKVKPTQQLQSPPPQHYNHVGYQGGYGGLSVPSPPAMLFNSSQQLLGSSQQLPQQGGLYGAFLDQSRGQFGGFPGTPYGAGSAAPYNYQPPPDMFSSIPSQYRMVRNF